MSTHALPAYRWLLLGASWIAETRLIPALNATGQQISAVLSSDEDRAQTYATRNGIAHGASYTDGIPAWCADTADAVYISATNDKHRALAEAAAAAGLHVLCEKPLADRVDDADAIVAACAAAGVVLAVNHHLVASGANTTIRRLVADGAVGRVLGIRVAHANLLPEVLRGWRLGAEPGAGVIPDVSSHDASVVNALLDPAQPRQVSAIGVAQGAWRTGSIDAAMAAIRYDGDVLVQTHDTFTTPHLPTRLEVLGSRGCLTGLGVLSQDPVGTVWVDDAGGRHEIDVADRQDLYEKVVTAFVRAAAGDGTPTVSGVQGLHAQVVAAAVHRSAATGASVHLDDWRLS